MDKNDIILGVRFKITIFLIIALFFISFTKQDLINIIDYVYKIIDKVI